MENDKIFPLASESSIYDLGKISSQNKVEQTFNIQNLTSSDVVIESITSPYGYTTAETSSLIVSGKKLGTIKIKVDTTALTGLNMTFVEVKIKGYTETLKLMLTFELVN